MMMENILIYLCFPWNVLAVQYLLWMHLPLWFYAVVFFFNGDVLVDLNYLWQSISMINELLALRRPRFASFYICLVN